LKSAAAIPILPATRIKEDRTVPIYEYRCEACGTRLEVMQKVSDKPLRHCPGCKKNRLRKLVSPTAFRLKGSGWYETDFKKHGKKNVIAAEGAEAKPDKAGKGDGKEAPAKPAEKTDKEKPAAKAKPKKAAAAD
jgi:putative FmdB family regulatory protein